MKFIAVVFLQARMEGVAKHHSPRVIQIERQREIQDSRVSRRISLSTTWCIRVNMYAVFKFDMLLTTLEDAAAQLYMGCSIASGESCDALSYNLESFCV